MEPIKSPDQGRTVHPGQTFTTPSGVELTYVGVRSGNLVLQDAAGEFAASIAPIPAGRPATVQVPASLREQITDLARDARLQEDEGRPGGWDDPVRLMELAHAIQAAEERG